MCLWPFFFFRRLICPQYVGFRQVFSRLHVFDWMCFLLTQKALFPVFLWDSAQYILSSSVSPTSRFFGYQKIVTSASKKLFNLEIWAFLHAWWIEANPLVFCSLGSERCVCPQFKSLVSRWFLRPSNSLDEKVDYILFSFTLKKIISSPVLIKCILENMNEETKHITYLCVLVCGCTDTHKFCVPFYLI